MIKSRRFIYYQHQLLN